ncbi:MAG: DUF4390 domain-containing protein [Gammaproteobacteria bacterium]
MRTMSLNRVVVFGLLAAFAVGAPPALATPAFTVEDTAGTLHHGVYYLDADLALNLNRQARDALANGVALTFLMQIHVIRTRVLLWNQDVAELTQRYRLSYLPLSNRYRVENLNSGAIADYGSLAAALAPIEHIRDLPLIDADLLARGVRYLAALRVVLDTRDLPGPLQLMTMFVPGWRLESEWHQWVLVP